MQRQEFPCQMLMLLIMHKMSDTAHISIQPCFGRCQSFCDDDNDARNLSHATLMLLHRTSLLVAINQESVEVDSHILQQHREVVCPLCFVSVGFFLFYFLKGVALLT